MHNEDCTVSELLIKYVHMEKRLRKGEDRVWTLLHIKISRKADKENGMPNTKGKKIFAMALDELLIRLSNSSSTKERNT